MKKITLLFLTLFMSFVGYSQLTENFDSSTGLPTGWVTFANSTGTVGSSSRWTITSTTAQVNTAPNAIRSIYYPITSATNPVARGEEWIVSKAIDVPTAAQLQFNIKKLVANLDPAHTFQVRVSQAPASGNVGQDNVGNYTLIQEWLADEISDTPTLYTQKTLDLSAYATGSKIFVAFVRVTVRTEHQTQSVPGGLLIDDFEVATRCQPVTGLTVAPNIGLTQARLSWNTPGGATKWDIVIVREDQTFESGTIMRLPVTQTTVSAANPYVATETAPGVPLVAGTDYKYYVRAVCSETNKSVWSSPSYFTTAGLGETCADPFVIPRIPYTLTDNTFNSADRYDAGQGASALCGVTGATNYTTGNDMFYTFTAPTTGSIRIEMTPNTVNSGMFVYASCATLTQGTCLAGVANANATPRVIERFPVTAGQTYIILLSSSGTTTSFGYDLELQYVFCDPPVSLNAVPTRTDATLTWANPTTFVANGWEVAVQTAGSVIPQGAGFPVAGPMTNPTVSAALAFGGPLQEGTNYQFWVRANCGDGTFSRWEGPFVFFTPFCDAPNFCAHTFTLRGTTGWQGAIMHVRQNGVTVKILGPEFITGTSQTVSVNLCTGIPFDLVWVSPGLAPATVAITVINSFGQTLLVKNANAVDLPSTTPILTEMVDCLLPKCLPPTAPSALLAPPNAPTATGANLTWTPAPSTSEWEVDIRLAVLAAPANTDPVQAPRITSLSANYSTLPQGPLLSDTEYKFYVRTICGTKKSDWVPSTIFRTAVSCPAPTFASLRLVSRDRTSANFSWEQPSLSGANPPPAPTAWEVIVVTAGSQVPLPTTHGTRTVNNTNSPYSGLNSGTAYEYYVRAECSNIDYSKWVGPFAFVTVCDPINVPYTETFNTNSTTKLCWNVVNISPGANVWKINDDPTGVASGYASMDPNKGTNNNDWLVSADIVLPPVASGEYRVKFKYRVLNASGADAPNTIEVLLSTTGSNPTVAGTFSQTLMPRQTWNNVQYLEKVINLDTYAGSTVNIAWHLPSGIQNRNKIFIDDVVFERIPACPEPTDLGVVAVAPTNATLKWSPGFRETEWQVFVQPIGGSVPPSNYAGLRTLEHNNYLASTLSNGDPLESATDYEFYVRAYCSATAQSQWVGPFRFKTLCGTFNAPFFEGFNSSSARQYCWTVVNANNDADSWDMDYTTNPYQGDHSASLFTDLNNGNNNDWLISPNVILTGNQRLRFRYRVATTSPTDANNFEVLLSTTGSDIAGFTNTVIPLTLYNNATYLESITNLVGYTGAVNIAWHVPQSTVDGNRIYIDNVFIEDIPNCPTPINVQVDCIGSDRANFEWTTGGSETSWEIGIVEAGQPIPTSGTTILYQNFYYANGLNPETQYEFFIRAICPAAAGGGYGAWNPLPFKTVTRSLVDAAPFCASANPNASIVFQNTSDADNIPNLSTNRVACLATTPNPVWYYLEVDTPGNLFFEISQRTGHDNNGNLTGATLDVDYAAWGPFTSLNQACDQIAIVTCPTCPNNTAANGAAFYPFGNIVDCSYDARATETLTIENVLAGQVYAILITNFDGDPGFIKFSQLPTSTGSTNCNILYSVDAGVDKNLCGVSSTTITANADIPATSANPTFTWFRDTLPFTPTILSSTGLSQTIEVSDLGRHVYKVEITVPGGLNTVPITDETVIVLGPTITAVIPPVYNMCDDVTNDGFAEFDLTTLYSQALGSMLPADYTASVYLTEILANVGTTSIPIPDRFTNTTINTQTVFVRVQSNLVPDCYQVVAAVLKVNPSIDPEVDFTLPAQVCITDPNPTAAQFPGFTSGGQFSTNSTGLVIDATSGEINLAASAPGTYEVVYTILADPSTCTPLTVTTPAVQIIVNPAGVPVTGFDYIASVCVADTNQVLPRPIDTVLFTPGGTYSVDITSPTPASSMTIDPITGEINLASTAPGIYVIKYEILASACGTAGSTLATIEIKALATPNVTFAYNSVCQNASTSILPSTAPVTPGGIYTATGITVNSTTGAIDLTGVAPGSYSVRYEIFQDITTCTSGDFFVTPIVVTASTTPDSFFEYETSYCRNAGTVSPLAPSSTFEPGGTFTVTPLTGLVINATSGDIDVNASTPGSYEVTYLITADTSTCRTESRTVKTVVISADFDVTVDNDCVNAAYVLTATPNDPSYTYTWKNAAGTVVGTNSPTFNVTEYVGNTSPVYPLLFTVTVNNGCDVTEPFSVPNIACNIPKGISPNGDGDNDEFDLTGFNVRRLEIFNRYGKKVNSFTNYRKEWRGQSDGGSDLPDGTYYYVIEREGVKTVSGWVQINRQRN